MGGPLQGRKKRWRWAVGSQIGTSHLKHGTRKQDAFAAKALPNDAYFFAVSDGAGSAAYGGQGASLTCRLFSTRLREWFATSAELPANEQVLTWLDEIRDLLASLAETRSGTRRDFASTLVALIHTPKAALALQIGDSAMVGRTVEGTWEAICWPENGEFASSTFFVTDDPEVRLRTALLDNDYDAFALFSDGLEDMALEQETALPFLPFFEPMLAPIDNADGQRKLATLSAALDRYLSSEPICERTDDDKTLILISSRP